MSALNVVLVTKGLDLGGQERVVADLAIGLHRRGVTTKVAVVNGARQRLTPRLEAAGVPVVALGGNDHIGITAARRLHALGDAGTDVVHVHSPLPACVCRLGTDAPRRLVTTLHTPWPALHLGTRWAWHLTARRDHAMVAVSAAVAASLPRALGERTSVIPHATDAAAIVAAARDREATRSMLHETLSIPRDRAVVVTVASHRRAKNYPDLLAAFQRVLATNVDAHLIAIGAGDQLEAHRALAAQLGLGRHVTFLPPRDDVLSVIAAADVVAVASKYEGQPLVVVEALALGRPIVATAVGRVPELVPTGAGRVVQPDDPVAFGHALVAVLSNASLRSAMSVEAARSHASAWTLDDAIDAHVRLYESVVR